VAKHQSRPWIVSDQLWLLTEPLLPAPEPKLVQLLQQHRVQLVPGARLVPDCQAPPAGHTRAEAQLLGQILPLDTGVQHEQDPAQGLPVRHPGSPSTSLGPGSGSNGSMNDHSSSDTIHGRD
jgi:hypothetical protein